MGVHTLWNILEGTGEENVTVRSLRGKKLAVDLSAWIVELKQSKVSAEFPNAYIRNLFFRTIEFMKEGVELIFVTDGRAPELKQQALLTRQQNQFGSSSSTANTDRLYLRNATSLCVEMLGYLGLPCVQSLGEAEAMCAHLNSKGLVDGCLTEDNDFFLYGGKTLYRRLTKENKMYIVEKFDMGKINADRSLERRDLVALALLLGSDYNEKGVKSVGKETGMALVELLKSRNLDVLDRLIGWRNNKELDNIEEQLSVKTKHLPHCSKCDHLGRVSAHDASGCSVCGTESGCHKSCNVTCQCDWHKQETLRKQNKLEIQVRQKSLQNEIFPNKEVIEEFLNPRLHSCEKIPKVKMNLPKLITFRKDRLSWSSDKVLEKMVPIVIVKELREKGNQHDLMFTPIRILRSCKESHIECYEVSWDKTDKNDWAGTNFSTNIKEKIEKALFKTVYPTMVLEFEKSLAQKSKTGKGKKRKSEAVKGQPKLTDYTKVRKKLPFNEEAKGKTQKLDFVNIDDDNCVDLTYVNSDKTSKSADKIAVTAANQNENTDEKVDIEDRIKPQTSWADSTKSSLCKGSKFHEQDTSCINSVKSREQVSTKSQQRKVSRKDGSGKRGYDKQSAEASSNTDIRNFFVRKVKSDTKDVEFKQNDTTVFRTLNKSETCQNSVK